MNVTQKAHIVSLVDVRDPQAYEEYVHRAGASVAAFGGSFILKSGNTESLEGDFVPSRIVIVEFRSLEVARDFYSSPEYQKAAAYRRRGAKSLLFLAKGV